MIFRPRLLISAALTAALLLDATGPAAQAATLPPRPTSDIQTELSRQALMTPLLSGWHATQRAAFAMRRDIGAAVRRPIVTLALWQLQSAHRRGARLLAADPKSSRALQRQIVRGREAARLLDVALPQWPGSRPLKDRTNDLRSILEFLTDDPENPFHAFAADEIAGRLAQAIVPNAKEAIDWWRHRPLAAKTGSEEASPAAPAVTPRRASIVLVTTVLFFLSLATLIGVQMFRTPAPRVDRSSEPPPIASVLEAAGASSTEADDDDALISRLLEVRGAGPAYQQAVARITRERAQVEAALQTARHAEQEHQATLETARRQAAVAQAAAVQALQTQARLEERHALTARSLPAPLTHQPLEAIPETSDFRQGRPVPIRTTRGAAPNSIQLPAQTSTLNSMAGLGSRRLVMEFDKPVDGYIRFESLDQFDRAAMRWVRPADHLAGTWSVHGGRAVNAVRMPVRAGIIPLPTIETSGGGVLLPDGDSFRFNQDVSYAVLPGADGQPYLVIVGAVPESLFVRFSMVEGPEGAWQRAPASDASRALMEDERLLQSDTQAMMAKARQLNGVDAQLREILSFEKNHFEQTISPDLAKRHRQPSGQLIANLDRETVPLSNGQSYRFGVCEDAAEWAIAVGRAVTKAPMRIVFGHRGDGLRRFTTYTGHAWFDAQINGRWVRYDSALWNRENNGDEAKYEEAPTYQRTPAAILEAGRVSEKTRQAAAAASQQADAAQAELARSQSEVQSLKGRLASLKLPEANRKPEQVELNLILAEALPGYQNQLRGLAANDLDRLFRELTDSQGLVARLSRRLTSAGVAPGARIRFVTALVETAFEPAVARRWNASQSLAVATRHTELLRERLSNDAMMLPTPFAGARFESVIEEGLSDSPVLPSQVERFDLSKSFPGKVDAADAPAPAQLPVVIPGPSFHGPAPRVIRAPDGMPVGFYSATGLFGLQSAKPIVNAPVVALGPGMAPARVTTIVEGAAEHWYALVQYGQGREVAWRVVDGWTGLPVPLADAKASARDLVRDRLGHVYFLMDSLDGRTFLMNIGLDGKITDSELGSGDASLRESAGKVLLIRDNPLSVVILDGKYVTPLSVPAPVARLSHLQVQVVLDPSGKPYFVSNAPAQIGIFDDRGKLLTREDLDEVLPPFFDGAKAPIYQGRTIEAATRKRSDYWMGVLGSPQTGLHLPGEFLMYRDGKSWDVSVEEDGATSFTFSDQRAGAAMTHKIEALEVLDYKVIGEDLYIRFKNPNGVQMLRRLHAIEQKEENGAYRRVSYRIDAKDESSKEADAVSLPQLVAKQELFAERRGDRLFFRTLLSENVWSNLKPIHVDRRHGLKVYFEGTSLTGSGLFVWDGKGMPVRLFEIDDRVLKTLVFEGRLYAVRSDPNYEKVDLIDVETGAALIQGANVITMDSDGGLWYIAKAETPSGHAVYRWGQKEPVSAIPAGNPLSLTVGPHARLLVRLQNEPSSTIYDLATGHTFTGKGQFYAIRAHFKPDGTPILHIIYTENEQTVAFLWNLGTNTAESEKGLVVRAPEKSADGSLVYQFGDKPRWELRKTGVLGPVSDKRFTSVTSAALLPTGPVLYEGELPGQKVAVAQVGQTEPLAAGMLLAQEIADPLTTVLLPMGSKPGRPAIVSDDGSLLPVDAALNGLAPDERFSPQTFTSERSAAVYIRSKEGEFLAALHPDRELDVLARWALRQYTEQPNLVQAPQWAWLARSLVARLEQRSGAFPSAERLVAAFLLAQTPEAQAVQARRLADQLRRPDLRARLHNEVASDIRRTAEDYRRRHGRLPFVLGGAQSGQWLVDRLNADLRAWVGRGSAWRIGGTDAEEAALLRYNERLEALFQAFPDLRPTPDELGPAWFDTSATIKGLAAESAHQWLMWFLWLQLLSGAAGTFAEFKILATREHYQKIRQTWNGELTANVYPPLPSRMIHAKDRSTLSRWIETPLVIPSFFRAVYEARRERRWAAIVERGVKPIGINDTVSLAQYMDGVRAAITRSASDAPTLEIGGLRSISQWLLRDPLNAGPALAVTIAGALLGLPLLTTFALAAIAAFVPTFTVQHLRAAGRLVFQRAA